jgi:mono/diheme cytochrome c family protein
VTLVTATSSPHDETYISAVGMQRIATLGDGSGRRQGGENRNNGFRTVSYRLTNTFIEVAIMKTTKIAMLIVTIAVALFILMPSLSWAEDGAALYKAKCAMCHGPDGAGKPAAKIPSLVSDEVKAKSDADIIKFVQTNPKHGAVAKALNEEQLKAVVGAIRDLQKK